MRIVSGGQTGVDRGALEAAMDMGLPHGGWCPKGRLAEDGRIPLRFQLEETPERRYAQRTEWNVRDSDGTLILTSGSLEGGSRLTWVFAERFGKPSLVVDPASTGALDEACRWVAEEGIELLNVAGPRESGRPGIQERSRQFVTLLLERIISPS